MTTSRRAPAEHFDCVVVGTGFGGSVTAQRLAAAGRRVLVLERGKPYPPGSFPRSPIGFKRNLWDPSEGLHGLFDLWSFSGLDALVSSGLGGGSLIYANVLLRKDEKWFVSPERPGAGGEAWPLRREDLEEHYDRVERAIGVQRYPLDHAPYDRTPKTLAFKAAAEERGMDWFLPPLAVTFANPGAPPGIGEPIAEERPNLHGRPRQTCRLVGECDVGCNYGAKNTLDYTYLTEAWHAGAEIRTRCEVREFEPREGGGWTVHYLEHTPEREGSKTDTRSLPRVTVTAGELVLAAGTLGSTYLLLRNRAALPGLSPRVGEGFSGNGDLLTFAARCTESGMGGARAPRVIDPAYGPVITSAVRVPDALDGDGRAGRGFYIEDAGYPEFVSWMLQVLDTPSALARALPILLHFVRTHFAHGNENISAEASDLLGDCHLSSGALPLLVMGRDVPDGLMSLRGDRLEVDWRKDRGSERYFDEARQTARGLSDALGGQFLDNPIWLLSRVITVHPLGGCRMGRTDAEGVVDPYGRVFNCPGLHVADGAVMPGPVGANPSLTIAALADRFADAMIEGAPAADARPARRAGSAQGAPPAAGPAPGPGAVRLRFTEEMKGHLDFEETDYERAYAAGKAVGRKLMFHLTITADDVERFIADRRHEAGVSGWVRCESLGGRRPVEGGHFNLFVDQDGDRRHKRMYYRLFFRDGTGHPLTLVGFKEVRDDPGFDVWKDTSTLYTRVLAGTVAAEEEPQAEVLATAILHILRRDFARQLTTFRVDPARRVDALARFGSLFAGSLWETYGPLATR
jgi:cholesterol oxidase